MKLALLLAGVLAICPPALWEAPRPERPLEIQATGDLGNSWGPTRSSANLVGYWKRVVAFLDRPVKEEPR